MSGPLTASCSSVVLLLCLTVLLPPLPLKAKSLSIARGVGGRGSDTTGGGIRRARRDLRDSLPYEAGMMSYPGESADVLTRRGGNELLYQPEEWRGQGLGQALQQLLENDQRREQETAYLAGLLRLLNEAEGAGVEEDSEEDQVPGDFQGPYPQDYDETEPGMRMGKPQAAAQWQGLLDPQLTQALLNRYRQERQQAASPSLPASINRLETGGQDPDQETLRYLVAKILSSISPNNPQRSSGRRARRDLASGERPGGGARRDLASVSGAGVRAASGPVLHRSRRSLDSPAPPSPSQEPPLGLLRVKRLGDVEEGPGRPEGERDGHKTSGHAVGLQRMKRIDTDLQPAGRSSRRRRAVTYDLQTLTYDPEMLVQHILHYLPQ
ncbi:proprotein convertase subtilisin/kexin type 1 inhibitor, like [Esox lucius]|uniref:proprotein convertase subtilisin/kexin type 1 inhibitor, like n=1 Tax=Esox lucius TaxID=8010 RepID=UPI00057676BA|nr:proprotein convertase subtilisin/kexin type 1 inhibitor, like [Esox lucius]